LLQILSIVFGVFDPFKIGDGPSSSHTMAPMTAASDFVARAAPFAPAPLVAELFGSLALNDKGHSTGAAIILGLCGVRLESLCSRSRRDGGGHPG
jgi:L-serine dehydratase